MRQSSQGVLINIKVIPGASRTEIVGWEQKMLKVRVAAPPEKGEANEELVRFLKKRWKTEVLLIKGASSRHKTVCLAGKTLETLPSDLEHNKDEQSDQHGDKSTKKKGHK